MALYDDPPMSVSTYTVTTARDSGGGQAFTYTLAQSGVACSINMASASTQREYAQDQIVVTNTISALLGSWSPVVTRGMKVVADDTQAVYIVEGIRNGRAYGNIPALTYLDVRELLG